MLSYSVVLYCTVFYCIAWYIFCYLMVLHGIASDSRGPTSIVRGASESGKRSYTTSPRGTNILHYLVGRIKPEHFMMQNICMATESTSSFYQNEPNKMQNKNVGKTAAQLHFSAKIENCSSSPPFRRHPRILCL